MSMNQLKSEKRSTPKPKLPKMKLSPNPKHLLFYQVYDLALTYPNIRKPKLTYVIEKSILPFTLNAMPVAIEVGIKKPKDEIIRVIEERIKIHSQSFAKHCVSRGIEYLPEHQMWIVGFLIVGPKHGSVHRIYLVKEFLTRDEALDESTKMSCLKLWPTIHRFHEWLWGENLKKNKSFPIYKV